MKKLVLNLSLLGMLVLTGCASQNVVVNNCCSNSPPLHLPQMSEFKNRIASFDVRVDKPQSEELHVVPSMTIDSKVLFAFDKSTLSSQGKKMIAQISTVASKNINKPILLVGSTDFFGTAKYNEKLAEKRAIVVSNEFIKNGIPSDKIRIQIHLGQKEQQIIDNCHINLKECVAPDRNTSMLIKLDI